MKIGIFPVKVVILMLLVSSAALLYVLPPIWEWHEMLTAIIIGNMMILGLAFATQGLGQVRDSITLKERIIIGTVAILLLFAGYNYLSYRQHQQIPNDTTIPTMSQFAEGIHKFTKLDIYGDNWIMADAKTTLSRLFYGLALSIAASFLLGIMMGCKSRWESFFLPIVRPIAKIPPTGALAIFFIMVGTGTEMFIAMIFFGVMPVLTQNVYDAVKSVPNELLNKARTLGASEPEIVWDVIIPYIMPQVLSAICLQIGPSIVYLIPAEMLVSGSSGFGYRIRIESKIQNMNVAFLYLVMLAALGFSLEYSLKQLQRWLFPWYTDSRR